MSALRTCASLVCDNDVVRRPGERGRPRIYCSPECRPSRKAVRQLVVEMDQVDHHDDDGAGRSWVVRLRRGQRTVVVGYDLGRFSARALCEELAALLQPRARQKGDATE